MKLTLIRHGLTDALEQHLYYGASDVPLNEKGVAGLRLLREKLSYPQSGCMYTSGMLRTEQTFEVIYGKREHGVIQGMREMDFGIFEMKSYEMLKDEPLYQQWISGDFRSNIAPGGESLQILYDRCSAEADKLVRKGEDAVIVCHGGPIAAVMRRYFGGDDLYAFIPDPGRGYTLEFEQGKVLSYNKL